MANATHDLVQANSGYYSVFVLLEDHQSLRGLVPYTHYYAGASHWIQSILVWSQAWVRSLGILSRCTRGGYRRSSEHLCILALVAVNPMVFKDILILPEVLVQSRLLAGHLLSRRPTPHSYLWHLFNELVRWRHVQILQLLRKAGR